jgi:TQXA domain-containing protein/LPXTG-motif cell wall-anchored protein
MFRVRGRVISRLPAVMLMSGALMAGSFTVAGAAAAQDGASGAVGATAELQPGLLHHGEVVVDGVSHPGGLFTLSTAQGDLYTYCIDFGHSTKPNSSYQESDWGGTSLATNPDAGKIKWILENSYPTKTVAAVATAAGISGDLTEDDAAAGTQAAIWHFSDGKNAVPKDAEAATLTSYLEAHAAAQDEPQGSLELSPQAVSGRSGELVGPVTIATNSDAVELKLDSAAAKAGVLLVDKNGKELTGQVGNGTEVYFSVPNAAPAGQATLTASASTEVPVGRVFTSLGYTAEDHSQTMILAGSQRVDVSAAATAAWSPKKGPIPAVTAAEDCSNGSVVVTVANNGDEDFTFTVNGSEVTVKPGGTENVPVKVAEDKPYDIKVTGANGFSKEFKGVLDCKTSSSTGGTGTGTGGNSPSPAASTSTSPSPGSSTSPAAATGGDLAETGSSSATPMIAAVAGGLVVLGGGLVFMLRKRRSSHSA